MHLFRQKINWKAIVGQVGLLLHVPAIMAFITLAICFVFEETFALLPFGMVALFSLIMGQLMYRLTKGAKAAHLWDAMVIAGISWLACSVIAAVPIYWIAHVGPGSKLLQIFTSPTNALFEAFSGLTSTGLTMLQGNGSFPYVLQWWRSFLEWVGGLGLVVFILSLTHLNKEGFQLYYAEARSDQMAKNITGTAHWICVIYLLFTGAAFLIFFFLGMPIWEAINHGMTVMATGGFTLSDTSFHLYSPSIQIAAMFLMIVAAMSFAVHYRVIREKEFGILWKSLQHRLLYFLAIGGGFLVLLLNWWNGVSLPWIPSFFQWVSALTTCGFSAAKFAPFSPMVKLLLIVAMFIGGATGSTAGGIKLRRLLYLLSGIKLRILSLTTKREKHITQEYSEGETSEEPPGIDLSHSEKTERLFTAIVLFILWIFTLFLGWFFILRWAPEGWGVNALFEVTSAMSNVGLTSGLLTPDFSTAGKWIFMFLMWVGRLEIIPALVLFLTVIPRRSRHGKRAKS